MDLICTRCGERWDLDHVLHEEPGGFDRMGGLIRHCPACPAEKPKLSAETQLKLAGLRAMAQLLGNDVDGLAAAIADSEL